MNAYRKCRCGNLFTPPANNLHKRFCSKACSNADYTERRRGKKEAGNKLRIIEGPCTFCQTSTMTDKPKRREICQRCYKIRMAHEDAVVDASKERIMVQWVYEQAAKVRKESEERTGVKRHPLGYRPAPAAIIGDK